MALPKINTPTYQLTLPSQDKKIKYRPFLVKDEKVLLVAMESQDEEQIFDAMKNVIRSCILTKIDVDTLPMFDLEYIFLKIRSKSVGETSTINVLCPDDEKTYVQTTINLDDIDVQVDDNHTNNIKLTDDIGIVLQYPNYESLRIVTKEGLTTENIFKLIKSCIAQVYDGDSVYETSDFTEKEINEFLEGFTTDNLNKVKTFFDTMPRLRHEVEVENPETKVKSKVVLEGLNNFF